MAELNKTVLGRLSGAVGDIIFRQRNGKNYVGTKPSSFIPGNDDASVARRAKFALSTKLARTINSIPQLKSVWSAAVPSGLTPYNYIIKINYNNIDQGVLSDNVVLTPDIGFGVNASSLSIASSGIQADLEAIGNNEGIDPVNEVSLQLVAVIHLSNPADSNIKPYSFLSFVSAVQVTDLDNPLSFSMSLSTQEAQIFDQYQDHKVFFSLLTLDANESVVKYSSTFVG